MSEPTEALTEVSRVGNATVIRLLRPALWEQHHVDAVGGEFVRLAEAHGVRLLVDFGPVEIITSSVIAKLIDLQRRLQAVGGRLAVCCPAPEVRDLFRITHTDKLLAVHSDQRQALAHLA